MGVGLAGWSAVLAWDVGVDVVDVEPATSPAPGEPAAVVAVLDLGAEPVGDLVGVDGDVLGQVDDRGELIVASGRGSASHCWMVSRARGP